MTSPLQPILESSCARATSAAEMRYRINRPIAERKGVRVIALDDARERSSSGFHLSLGDIHASCQ